MQSENKRSWCDEADVSIPLLGDFESITLEWRYLEMMARAAYLSAAADRGYSEACGARILCDALAAERGR